MPNKRDWKPAMSFVNVPGSYSDQPKNNKHQSFYGKIKMVMKMCKRRARNIHIGAASIINKWQNPLLLYWLISITFIFFTIGCLIIISTLRRHPSTLSDNEKCLLRHTHASSKINMSTKTNLFLHIVVNSEDNFDIYKYKSLLVRAIKNHPSYNIHIYVLYNDLLHNDYKRNSRSKTWETYHNGSYSYSFFDTSSAESSKESGVNYHRIYDNVHMYQSTFSQYFNHSPLKLNWRTIPPDIIPVALRILSIWEHGGITLSWDLFLDKNQYNRKEPPKYSSKIRNIIEGLKKKLSSSVIKPRDPIETKKQLIEMTTFDLNQSSGNNYYPSNENTTEILQAYHKIQKLNINQTNKTKFNINISKFKQKFLTPSEQNSVKPNKGLLKLTVRGLTGEARSYKKLSSVYYTGPSRSSVYHPRRDNALPKSSVSLSREFQLRPRPKRVLKQEMMRFINGVKKFETIYIAKKKIRIPLAKFCKNISHSSETQENGDNHNHKFQSANTVKTRKLQSIQNSPSKMRSSEVRTSESRSASERSEESSSELLSTESRSYESRSDMSNETSENSSESESYMSSESSQKMFGGNSSEKRQLHIKIREQKGYRNNRAFKTMNVFSIPDKKNIIIDESGYYISVRKPCNIFLSNLIDILKQPTDYMDSEGLIENGIRDFCGSKKFSQCEGITLL